MIREEIRPLLAALGLRKRRNRFVRDGRRAGRRLTARSAPGQSRHDVRFTTNLVVRAGGAQLAIARMDPRGHALGRFVTLVEDTGRDALAREIRAISAASRG